ncbi:MAG: tRNA (adenosine(37)-N6)-dimethylallyltransferase MiaA [bacterium]|nr:tRNA (adenosine(37)-N6)-dimethylallyltransferase MiaA [bacterium]
MREDSPAPPRLLVVLGPTGTGKSALAVRLAEALGGEVVGCDALQVYRGFDLGTAKPTADELRRVPHHLVDDLDPTAELTLHDYVRRAESAVAEIAARGNVPLVAGGSGMYLRGLLRGVVSAPARDDELRLRLRRVAERRGSEALHRWLVRLDPASAERILPSDLQRLIRAIELALTSGRTWSELLHERGTWGADRERYPSLKIGLTMDRERLRSLLDARVQRFFDAGLVGEVRELLARGVPPGANAFKAIGYREVLAAIGAGEDPLGVVPDVQRNTRRYAKRQRTWFRKEPDVNWIDAARDGEEIAREAIGLWNTRKWYTPRQS